MVTERIDVAARHLQAGDRLVATDDLAWSNPPRVNHVDVSDSKVHVYYQMRVSQYCAHWSPDTTVTVLRGGEP